MPSGCRQKLSRRSRRGSPRSWCKLTFVRSRPTAKILSSKAVLLVLVALQLVIGLQFQVAQAASVRMTMPPVAGAVNQPAGARAHADCPTHSTHGAAAVGTHPVGTDKHAPMGTHDC